MGHFFILFITILILSCSTDIENDKVPKNNSLPMEKRSATPLKTKSKSVIDEHISGNGTQNISGIPSTHISGKK